MVDWPTNLPCTLQIDSQTGGIADGRIRSATDTGPGKMRRRTTAMAEPLAGEMIMTKAEIQILRDFIDDDLFGGVLVFFFKDPLTGVMVPVRFAENLPTWTPLPGKKRYRVFLDLEKMP